MTKIAIKFIKKELHGHTDAETVIAYIQRSGFSVIFYDLNKDRDTLKQCNVLEYCQTVNNFTVSRKSCHIVFICNKLPSEEKHIALIHEAAHIYLGHLNENVHISNERKNEAEAEAFTYAVLTYKRNDRNIRNLLAILIIFVFVVGLINRYIPEPTATNRTPVTTTPMVTPSVPLSSTSDNNSVYVTPTGNKFHRKDCRYTKDKKCIELPIEQAQIKYEPCKICKPQCK